MRLPSLGFRKRHTDDCGMPVRLASGYDFRDWPTTGDDRIRLLILRLRANAHPFQDVRFALRSLVLGLSWLFIGGVAALLIGWALRGAPQWVQLILLCLGAGTVGHVLRVFTRESQAARRRDIVLAEGLCAACGYNLHGVRVEAGGHMLCPECGAAWNSNRIRRSAPFVAPGDGVDCDTQSWDATVNWSVRDARNVFQPLAFPTLRNVRTDLDGIEGYRARVNIARVEISRHSRWSRWAFGVVLAGVFGAAGTLLVLIGYRTGSPVVPIIGIVLLTLTWIAVMTLNVGYSKQGTCRGLLKMRLCPSCLEDLDALRPFEGGIALCPRCLASWNMPEPPHYDVDPLVNVQASRLPSRL